MIFFICLSSSLTSDLNIYIFFPVLSPLIYNIFFPVLSYGVVVGEGVTVPDFTRISRLKRLIVVWLQISIICVSYSYCLSTILIRDSMKIRWRYDVNFLFFYDIIWKFLNFGIIIFLYYIIINIFLLLYHYEEEYFWLYYICWNNKKWICFNILRVNNPTKLCIFFFHDF